MRPQPLRRRQFRARRPDHEKNTCTLFLPPALCCWPPRRYGLIMRSPPSLMRTKPVKFKGTVTKMEWINPHAWIHIDVKGEDGKVTPWMIEAAAPNALLRRGWTKNSLPAGHGNPRRGFPGERRNEPRQRQACITFTDGKKFFVGSSAGDWGRTF